MSSAFRLTFRLDGRRQSVDVQSPRVRVGRQAGCDVLIEDESVSRTHAEILADDEGWTIRDAGSRNGTYVNLNKIDQARLNDRDIIVLGRMEMTFEVLEWPPGASRSGIEFSDRDRDPLISQAIDVENFRARLHSDSGIGRRVERQATEEWAVPLFSRAAEALLSTSDLERLMSTILGLVFESLPAERGCIILFAGSEGERPLEIMRQRPGRRDEVFTVSNSVIEAVRSGRQAVLVGDSSQDSRFSQQQSIVLNQIRSVMCAPLLHEERIAGVIYLDTQSLTRPFESEHLEVLTTLALLSAIAVEQARLRDRLQVERERRQRLARYSAPSVVDRILSSGEGDDSQGHMIGELREATVLFLDLVDFTGISEQLAPMEATELLNGVFEVLTACVFEYEGTLDKFTGDGLIAVFGAPLPVEDHALRAVRAGLEMQRRLGDFDVEHEGIELRARIGINSGTVLSGDIGTPRRKDYTVIGDAVNVASRLESQVAHTGQVVIGSGTFQALGERARCRDLGVQQVKGKRQTVHAYLVEECSWRLPIAD